MRETLKKFFSQRDYEVIYVVTGVEGLDALDIEKPHIVILDLCLRDTHGFEILQKIKSKRLSCGVIIIASSASGDDRIEAIKLGMGYYLSKPFSVEMLRNIVSCPL